MKISGRLEKFDQKFITFLREYSDEFARLSLFILFFWFGILKVFELSPADPLVRALQDETFLRSFSSDSFMVLFGLFEMFLGLIALVPRLERITFLLIGLHLITTVMPLVMLPGVTWDGFLVPSLIGQYIIKNLALLGLGLFLFARLKPMTDTHSIFGEESCD